ncbi:EndoU domain-containing protein [Streptomyces sp. NPDC006649]|uniref:EndoU domain-containing protein n=1 Tax=Streptomyces sp. NPDC006649 TaxID=3156896 RepID=UPI0033A8E47C
MFPDHWSPDEVLHATRQVYLDHVRTGTLTTNTERSGRRTFDGVYQGVRITGTADTTGTILDFAPHPDQSDLQPPTHLTPPPPREPSDEPVIGDVALRFLTYGSTSGRTGVHHRLPDAAGTFAQRDHGVFVEPLWPAHTNGTQWATVLFRDPNLRGRKAQAVANGAPPPLEWQLGDREIGTVFNPDGMTAPGQLLFPYHWSLSDIRDAMAGAHRTARSSDSWVEVPEGGYLWEGVHDGVRMHGHVRDGEHLWARPSTYQPLLSHTSAEVLAVTAPTDVVLTTSDGTPAPFRIQRVIHHDSTLGLHITRVLPHPPLADDFRDHLVDNLLPAVREQLADAFDRLSPYGHRELSLVTFDMELTEDETVELGPDSELVKLAQSEDDLSLLVPDLMTVGSGDEADMDTFLRGIQDQLPPLSERPADWQGPQGQPHHEQDPVLRSLWESDVTTAVHRNTPAGILDEPGVRELLAQHRGQETSGPLTNTGTDTAVSSHRMAAAAGALGLRPSDLTSIEAVLRGSAPVRTVLDSLDLLSGRLGFGNSTRVLVKQMTEIGAPLADWWHFASYLHTEGHTMSKVAVMDPARARKLYEDSRAQPVPLVPDDTRFFAYTLGMHPSYLARLADALHVAPADVLGLGEYETFRQQPHAPEALARTYWIDNYQTLEDFRSARSQARFETVADELLGSDPDLTYARYRSFMHWSEVASEGLHIFTDQRLRELVEHWRVETHDGTDQVPEDYDPFVERERYAELLHLADRSAPLLDPAREQALEHHEERIKARLKRLDERYVGGVPQEAGPPATSPTDPPAPHQPAAPHPQSPHASRPQRPVSPSQSPLPPRAPVTRTRSHSAPAPVTVAPQRPTAPLPSDPPPPPPAAAAVPRGVEISRPSAEFLNSVGHAGPGTRRQFSAQRTVLPNGVTQAEITVRIHLDVKDGVTPELLQATKDMTDRGLKKYYDDPDHRLPNGDLLRVKAEFTEDPKQAHHTVALHLDRDGNGRSNSGNWHLSMATLEAQSHMPPHEIGHLMGLWDYYRDPLPGHKPWPVYDDHALMGGNYADPLFGRITSDSSFQRPATKSPYLRIMPRDLMVLGTSIGAAHRDTSRVTVDIPLDVRERVLRGNPRTGAIGLLAPHGAADRPRPVATGERNPNGTYRAGTHPDGSPRTVFPDHWTMEEALYAVRQVYLREQAADRLVPTTGARGIKSGNYRFTGDYQGVRITGTADGTGTVTDFAPHHDQTDLETPLHLEPPVLPELPDELQYLASPPGLTDDAAIGETALHFLTYGSTHNRTGVHYALPGPEGAFAQLNQGVHIHPLWTAHPNGTKWATVWFQDPNLRGRAERAAANGDQPPSPWQLGDQENGAILGTDGTTSIGQLLFPDTWLTHDLWAAIVVAHRNARGNRSWVEVPEGGYLWEGVYNDVRMHGHVRDGELLWVRPSTYQPPFAPGMSEVLAVTAPLHFTLPQSDHRPALFHVHRVIHRDGTLGMRITRVLEHPALSPAQHSRLVDQRLPEIREQLAAAFSRPDPFRRRELSWVTFDMGLSPMADPVTTLQDHPEVSGVLTGLDTSALTDLMTVDPADHRRMDHLLLSVANLLPPVPQTTAGWQGPPGQPHHEQDRVWASDVTTSLHRSTLAGLLEEPGVQRLLEQHRSRQPSGPLTNTHTHTGGNGNAGTGAGTGRTAVAAEALGLRPSDLTSIEPVLQGTTPLRPGLDALDLLIARLEAGPTGPFVRRMTEIGAPLSEWWPFSSYLHTKQLRLSDVVGMDPAGAKKLFNDSRALPLAPRETAAQAYALGVHPDYLGRLADTLHVRPEDVTNLGRDKSYWQRPLSPEAMARDYLVSEREIREQARLAREQARFNAVADELLGSEPTLAEERFRSFMNWSGVSHLPLDIFTDHRLRELVGHWRGHTNDGTDQVPASFDLREDGKRHADLLLAVELARLSGPLPPKLAEELARRERHIKSQLAILDIDYEGGVLQHDGPPATLSAQVFAALSGND